MSNETSKAATRRARHARFAERYFVGHGIDIGAGTDEIGNTDGIGAHVDKFPRILSCKNWDLVDGDAGYMKSVADDTYDFVHSSHCLEHIWNPTNALINWYRILKPGGYLVVTVPDEDLYEQGQFPSTFNGGHLSTFTIYKTKSWSSVSCNITTMLEALAAHSAGAKTIAIGLHDEGYDYAAVRFDQAACAEVDIEFIIQKPHIS